MKIFKSILLVILMTSLNGVMAQSENYLKENIAMTDIQTVDKGDGTFYLQMKLRDYGAKKSLPSGFGFQGYIFMDNGQFNDKVKGDGIYSTQKSGPTSLLKTNPVKKTIAYDANFKHLNKLSLDTGENLQRGLGCKFKRCGCPCSTGTICLACSEFGWDCWMPYDCEIIISLPF